MGNWATETKRQMNDVDEALRSAVTIPDDVPTAECPKCGWMQEDHDGFGVLHCFKCGYCTHAAVDGNVCSLCGSPLCKWCGRKLSTGDECARCAYDHSLGREDAPQNRS